VCLLIISKFTGICLVETKNLDKINHKSIAQAFLDWAGRISKINGHNKHQTVKGVSQDLDEVRSD
jgi:hypothetical protein